LNELSWASFDSKNYYLTMFQESLKSSFSLGNKILKKIFIIIFS
jgi:hypothetical protein